MLRSKLAGFAGVLLISGVAFADQVGGCPDINDIKAEGISMAEKVGPTLFITYNISKYNTPATWGFIIAPLEVDNEDAALESANEILSGMTAPGVPEQHNGATMICDYDTGHQNVYAAALNDAYQITPMNLKAFFKNRGR
jgi:hypothetical protein